MKEGLYDIPDVGFFRGLEERRHGVKPMIVEGSDSGTTRKNFDFMKDHPDQKTRDIMNEVLNDFMRKP